MKKNILFTLVLLVLAGGIWLWFGRGRSGPRARVDIAGAETIYIDLTQDGTHEIAGAALPVTLEVQDGKIRFVDSQCPDHLCEGFGWVETEYDTAVCMPAGVVLGIETE